MDVGLMDVLDRLSRIEREVSEIKVLLRSAVTVMDERTLEKMREAVKGFLALRDVVSRRWMGEPTVLDEFKRSRGHERG